jgi:hypothetical protein
LLFLKSDLHFNIEGNTISSWNEKGILFCNYYIYFSTVKKKIINNRTLVSLKKYKQRLLAKFKVSDARLARCLSYQIRKNFILALQQELGSLKLNEDSLKEVAQKMVKKIRCRVTKSNRAFERYIIHYKRLSDSNLWFILNFYILHTKSLNIPHIKDTLVFNKLRKLRIFFIDRLNNIIENQKKDVNNEKSISSFYQKKKSTNIGFILRSIKKICIAAPLYLIIIKLSRRGYYHKTKHYPIANVQLLHYEDSKIITIFSNLMWGLLFYYRVVNNFIQLKGIISGLRRSCIKTFVRKYKRTISWVYKTFGFSIYIKKSGKIYRLPSILEVSNMNRKFDIKNICNFDINLI